jgi:hypothetical protein
MGYLHTHKGATKMTTKTYDNTKSYPVRIEVMVRKGASLAQDIFQTEMSVTSPKTGNVLRGVRIDYLDDASIYQFEVSGAVDGRPTYQKILQGFEKGAVRTENTTKYHDTLVATVDLTAHDLRCIQLAWGGWQSRQEDYAD